MNNNTITNDVFYLLSEQSLENILDKLYQLKKDNQINILNEAIKTGFHTNVQDFEYKNLLFYFHSYTDQTGYELLDYLIQNGLDLQHLDIYNLNPLHYLVFCPDAVEMLVFFGVNPLNSNTKTPFSVLEKYNNELSQIQNSKQTQNKRHDGKKSIAIIEKENIPNKKEKTQKKTIL